MSFLNNTKVRLERNKNLLCVAGFLKASGLVSFMHTIEYNLKRKENHKKEDRFRQYYEEHNQEFTKVIDGLREEESKKTYQALLDVLDGSNYKALKKHTEFPQYFPKSIIGKEMFEPNGVVIDGGAYIGDTIISFMKTIGKCRKIYAWEPDENNLKELKRNVYRYGNVEIVEKGMWYKKDELCFCADGTDKSRVVDDSLIKIEVDSIDNYSDPEEKISFIKMDIEGAELNALEGGIETIKKNRPILAICIYHSYEDFWRIPKFIMEKLEEYELFIRAHSDLAGEIVAYGIPKEALESL